MRILCLVILLFSLFNVRAQIIDNSPYFKGFQNGYGIYHWTTSNGLPQSHISGITQAKNNLLYISTYDGIITYDGRKFTRLGLKFGKKELSPFVTAISTFGDSLIWASTKEIVLYKDHAIKRVIPIEGQRIFVPVIKKINGKIYVFAHSHIFLFEGSRLIPLISNRFDSKLQNYTFLTTVFYNNRLHTLAGFQDKKIIIRTDPATGNYSVIKLQKPVENISVQNDVLLLLSGKTWYTAANGYSLGKKSFATAINDQGRFQSGVEKNLTYFYNNQYLQIDSDKSSSLLDVGTLMKGNELFTTMTDHTGNLWLGTNSNGLFMFRKYPFFYPTILNQLNVTNSSHTFLDSKNTLWFDDDCNETFGMDIRTGAIKDRINGLCSWVDEEWSEDTIAFFGYGTGNYWFNRKTRQKSLISAVTFPVNNCVKRADGELIITTDGAMYLFNGKTVRKWKTFRNPKTTCNQILRISREHLYFATSEGLYRYRDRKWELLIDSRDYDNVDMRSLVLLKNTTQIIIGTAGKGLFRFSASNYKCDRLPVVPIQLQNCWSIIEDDYEQLWISSNNGIVQINKQELRRSFWWQRQYMTINHYKYETGIENVEFNSRTQNKGQLLPDGRILFSSLAGPIIIKPQNNSMFNALVSPIILEKISINQKDINPDSKKIAIKEGDFVQVQFTLPSFSLERVLQFEYRIKEYRDAWTVLGSRSVTLDNLPPGDYKLEIRLTSRKRSFEIPIHVVKREPNAWILYLVYIIVLVILIIIITIYLTRFIQRRKHAANNLRQQLKILEMEALRTQMNPHFIFNCLNTIQFLFISGNSDKANKYLSDFSTLMRITLDQLRGSITTLDIELKTMNLYINLEQLQFDDGFEFRLINELKEPLNRIKTPSMFLQIFIENAIIHGLKKTHETRPILTLLMTEDEKNYIFEVSDNGPGYNETSRADHKSVGLSLLRERFKLKSEVFNWDIDFYLKQNDSVINDIRTTVVITFGKTLEESTLK